MNKPLTPISGHQVALLKKSFRQLDTHRIADRFYAKLFERFPEVKHLFPPDMIELGTKLMSVFELVVFSFEETSRNQFTLQQAVIVPLRELGRKHDDKGILPKYYPIANALLIETMQQESGTDFTDEVRQCWEIALNQLTTVMLDESVLPARKPKTESGSTLREIFTLIKRMLKPTRFQ